MKAPVRYDVTRERGDLPAPKDFGLAASSSRSTIHDAKRGARLSTNDEDDERSIEAALSDDDDELIAQLTTDNPFGEVCRICQREHVKRPTIEQGHDDKGWSIEMVVRMHHATITSGLCLGPTIKATKQIAAHQLLERLEAHLSARKVATKEATVHSSARAELAPLPTLAELPKPARMLLAEMKQKKLLADYGYEHFAPMGPVHQRTYIVRAWAVTPGGKRLESDEKTASTMKQAEANAADALWLALPTFAQAKALGRIKK